MNGVSKTRRMLQLIELLQSGRTYNTRELAELSAISRRQVFRDLRALQDSGVPVLYDPQRQGYWLPAATYLPPTDLTLEETLSLLVLAHSLGRRGEGVPFQEPARAAAIKLLSNLPSQLRAHLGEFSTAVDVRVDANHPHENGRPTFEQLLQAIRDKVKVRIRYQSLFERSRITTLLSPYRLFFMRRAWYVVGRSSVHRALRTFHVGRIQSLELTGEQYEIPPRFSLDRYLGNAWGLVRERGERTRVVVRFQPLVAQNVAEVVWHKTQSLSWNSDGTLDFRVTVDGVREISWWILGYGDQAEVLEPQKLRDIIAGHAQRMTRIYARSAAVAARKPRTSERLRNGRAAR